MTDPATRGSPARPRRALTLQARLMVTVIGIVSFILVVVALTTSAILGSVLLQRLDDQLRSVVDANSGTVSAALATYPDIEASRVLDGQPVRPGFLLVIGLASSAATGAVVGEDGSISELTAAQLQELAEDLDGPSPQTVAVDDLGVYRVTAGRVGTESVVAMGLPQTEVQATIGQLLTTIAFATAGGLLLLGVATTLVIQVGLKPLRAIAGTATRVSQLRMDQGAVSIDERVAPDRANEQTEIGQVGAALNRLLDHVDASLDARQHNEERMRRFVADASHELRTPLASIRGYSELSLRDDTLSEASSEALGRIQAQSVRMTALVEDLLLLARLDEGQELVYSAVDLTRLALEAVADQRPAGPDHEWRVDLGEDPVVVAGDAARLHQVAANLLANARTHTPPGTAVTTSVTREDGDAVLRVHDDGPGIEPAVQGELFERFSRADRSRARRTGGTGLGLSIAKAIVDAHHGTITVHSAPGSTTFDVRLPARPEDPAPAT